MGTGGGFKQITLGSVPQKGVRYQDSGLTFSLLANVSL